MPRIRGRERAERSPDGHGCRDPPSLPLAGGGYVYASDFRGYLTVLSLEEATTSVELSRPASSGEWQLLPSVPNPFNPSTSVRYRLPEGAHVRLEVHDVLGQLVRTLVDAHVGAGEHKVRWDGRSAAGDAMPGGTSFHRLTVSGRHRQVISRKAVLLR